MIKAVIFDMDGLMVDTEIISYHGFKSIINEYGYDLTLEEYARDFSGKKLYTSLDHIKEHYHIDYDNDEKAKLMIELEQEYTRQHGIVLKPGLIELMDYLKENHYLLALATSSGQDRARFLLSQNNVFDYFDKGVYGPEVKRGKPYPDIFLTAVEKLGVKPCEGLVLEDSEAGIQSAYSASIPVICIPDIKQPGPEFASKTAALLPSLDKVIDYLEKQNSHQ